jgi:hypothetical protein
MENHNTCKFLTVEQVADRLQVSRATLFNWMHKGIFTEGKHYFKRGHVLRFVWSEELIQTLFEDFGEDGVKHSRVKGSAVPFNQNKSKPINWDY